MTKENLINQVSQNTGVSKAQTKCVIEQTIEEIRNALVREEKVQIGGFGTFETRKRAERPGKNPKTGETIIIAERMMPKFRPGKALKDQVAKLD